MARLPCALLLCLVLSSVQGRMHLDRRGSNAGHEHVKRQGLNATDATVPVDQPTPQPISISTSPTTTTTSTTTPLLPSLLPTLETTTSSISLPTTAQTTSTSSSSVETAASTSTTPSSAASASTSTSAAVISTSAGTSNKPASESVVNLTKTSFVSASGSASSTPTQAPDNSGSGISSWSVSKKSLVLVVAIASSVGLVAAIWTILRKWKFSPSRRFEERMKPIDWSPELNGAHDAVEIDGMPGLARSVSGSSHSLKRQPSMDSMSGSTRGLMSEVSYNAGVPGAYRTRTASPLPSYPPSIARQPSGAVHGGRYGEGYY